MRLSRMWRPVPTSHSVTHYRPVRVNRLLTCSMQRSDCRHIFQMFLQRDEEENGVKGHERYIRVVIRILFVGGARISSRYHAECFSGFADPRSQVSGSHHTYNMDYIPTRWP